MRSTLSTGSSLATKRASLYMQALGPLFHRLSPVLARLHGVGERRLMGTLRVRTSSRPFVQWLLWLARMPGAQNRAPSRVLLTPYGDNECWERRIGNQRLISHQILGRDQEIIERVGPLAVHLRTVVQKGGVTQRSRRTRMFGLALPSLLGLQIVARERAIDAYTFRCAVHVRSPLLGCLLRYDGALRFEDNP